MFRAKNKLDNSSQKFGVGLVTYTDPTGMIAEQFRTIRTNIQFSSIDKKIKSLVFTSSAPSEGKSTVSNNLAVTCANQGSKTLLIDADLRRPTIHQTFSLDNREGLSNYLLGNATPDDVIRATAINDLYVITSGPIPPNPAEILGSSKMQKFIKVLSEQFDLLIFDAPPVNTVTDTQVLATQVDGVILVVPQGIAQKSGVQHAKEMLEMVHANILGTVMNRVTERNSSSYYGIYYDGYYTENKK